MAKRQTKSGLRYTAYKIKLSGRKLEEDRSKYHKTDTHHGFRFFGKHGAEVTVIDQYDLTEKSKDPTSIRPPKGTVFKGKKVTASARQKNPKQGFRYSDGVSEVDLKQNVDFYFDGPYEVHEPGTGLKHSSRGPSSGFRAGSKRRRS